MKGNFKNWINFPGGSDGKASACKAGDLGSIPGSGKSPGKVNGNLPQYSCLKNPMDSEVWQAIVHGVARVRHDLATNTHTLKNSNFHFYTIFTKLKNWAKIKPRCPNLWLVSTHQHSLSKEKRNLSFKSIISGPRKWQVSFKE